MPGGFWKVNHQFIIFFCFGNFPLKGISSNVPVSCVWYAKFSIFNLFLFLYLVVGKSLLYVVHFNPNLVSLGFTWIHLGSLWLLLIELALNGTLWFTWVHLDLCSL